MMFNLIEGSDLHHDACYLMEMYGQPMHAAIETAVRMQAELTRRLARNEAVRLGGGPPYTKLHFLEEGRR